MGAPSTAEAAAVPAELAASDFFDPIDSDDED
jgi:type IV secretion system protein VirD4